MYIPEKKLILRVEEELKNRIPILIGWKTSREVKIGNLRADLVISARHKGEVYHFCIEIKRAGYPQYIREAVLRLKEIIKHNPSYYPVVVTPKIGEQGKKICNEHNMGYMDFEGNIKITTGSVFIEIEGKKSAKLGIANDAAQRQSIFSPKASRITKCLLYEPQKKWLQKEISHKTGLSKGMVSRVVRRMIEAGYLIEEAGKLKLSSFDDLLSARLESSLKQRRVYKYYYVWSQNPQRLMQALSNELSRRGIKYAFTQEAGASLIAPFSTFDIVSVYIESFDKFPAEYFSAAETKKGFNLMLIESPDETIFTAARNIKGMKVVDNFQLYLDLRNNPLRGEKQAEHILKIIRKQLK